MIFENKVILITGASSGIGADASRHMARLGGKIALVGRNETRLNAVADEIKADGSPTPFTIAADVTVDAERIINETVHHFGKLDVLVNSAGVFHRKEYLDTWQSEKFDDLMNINVKSVIRMTQLAIPHLEKTNGNVVNVSSISGVRAYPGVLSYAMTKAAINQFTKNVARELSSKKIRVNAIVPAIIRTPLAIKAYKTEIEKNVLTDSRIHPIGRIGEVGDTSAAIVFLAGDSASFITGALLPVDGGAISC